MGLSSNIIWHQTDFKGLKAILTEKWFKCSYSLEDIHWKSSNIQIAFPMLSFCDIPLSEMGDYIGKYGMYTIGIKREWAQKAGFTPVWYQTEHSPSLIELMRHRDRLFKEDWTDEDILIWSILSTIKNYQGDLKKYKFKSYRFYDEKEIRYVPTYNELHDLGIRPFLHSSQYVEFKQLNKGSSIVPELTLRFESNQIVYILISSLNQRDRIRGLVREYSNYKNIIFLSYKQIKEDIIGVCHNR